MSELTAIENKLRAISPALEDVIDVLQLVQRATGLGGAAASTGLAMIAAALKALDEHAAGAIGHDEFMAQIVKSHTELAGDRAAEDTELDAKFPAEPPADPPPEQP